MITVTGEALIDLVIDGDGCPRPRPGGGPFNTARTIGRLGLAPAFLGRCSGQLRPPATGPPRSGRRDAGGAAASRRPDHPCCCGPRRGRRAPVPLLPRRYLLGGAGVPAAGGRSPGEHDRAARGHAGSGHGTDRDQHRAADHHRSACGHARDDRPQLPPGRDHRQVCLPSPARAHLAPRRRGQSEHGRPQLPVSRHGSSRCGHRPARARSTGSCLSPTVPARLGRSCRGRK